MKLEDLQVYQMALDLGEQVWQIVSEWNFFAKDTVGKQLVKSSDSIAANISEGYGRYFFKENRQFCYYSRGSLMETKTWLQKARNRNLIADNVYQPIIKDLDSLSVKLNNYIKSIGNKTP